MAITTAQEDDAEQLALAELNPLRYRGYYYDNETGLYYLQSRYYNPELGRFISADGFEYIDTSNRLSANAYAYCWNCPVAFSDIEGTTPELAFDMDSLIAFFQNAGKYIKEKLQENFTNLQSKFNAFAEKAKFWITHPDVIINNMLSKLLGREVHLRFRLVEWIRDAFERAKQEHEEQQQESPQDEEYGIATLAYNPTIAEDEKTDNWLEAALKGLSIGIPAQFLLEEFEAMIQVFNPNFDYNTWFDSLGESIQNTIMDICLAFATFLHTAWNEFGETLEDLFNDFGIGKFAKEILGSDTEKAMPFISLFTDSFGIISDFKDGKYTEGQSMMSLLFDGILIFITLIFPETKAVTITANVIKVIGDESRGTIYNYQNGHYWG